MKEVGNRKIQKILSIKELITKEPLSGNFYLKSSIFYMYNIIY